MKNTFVVLIFFFSTLINAQNCNIGNETSSALFSTAQNRKDALVGIKFNLAQESTLRTINIIGNNGGTNVKMAIYSDVNDSPNELVSFTGSEVLESGLNTFSVTPTILESGDYWIMAIFETTGNHTKLNFAANNKTYFKNIDFEADLPQNASDFESYSGDDHLYFLGLDCGNTLSNQNFTVQNIKLYPNPSKNRLQIIGLNKKSNYKIFNSIGQKVLQGTITNEEISTTSFKSGIYFIQVDNYSIQKFIKN